jgi:hypothetical protein
VMVVVCLTFSPTPAGAQSLHPAKGKSSAGAGKEWKMVPPAGLEPATP